MFAIQQNVKRTSDASLDRDVEALVRDLAERSVAATRDQLGTAAEKMDAAELRGYARARAMRLANQLVRQLVADGRLHPRLAKNTAARAADRTANLIVRERMLRPISVPTLLVPLRAAA
jgi:hypothetical protein